MLHWTQDHGVVLSWLVGVSVVLFVATLLVVPAIVVRIPADYFAHAERPPSRWAERGRGVRLMVVVVKNLLGYVFMGAGIAMLVLPGQGLLSLFIGFLLVDLPGKYRLEKWIISRPAVLKAINWFRRRRGCAPLEVGGREMAPAIGNAG